MSLLCLYYTECAEYLRNSWPTKAASKSRNLKYNFILSSGLFCRGLVNCNYIYHSYGLLYYRKGLKNPSDVFFFSLIFPSDVGKIKLEIYHEI